VLALPSIRTAAAALSLVLAGCSEAGAGASSISPQALLERIRAGHAPVILDVRSPEEYAGGRVPGAINIPHGELPERLGELGPVRDREIVVYCERGPRAAKAEAILRDARFGTVEHLEGDMSTWRAARLPCEGC
jgi:rhodanese-related sulfurtransferase